MRLWNTFRKLFRRQKRGKTVPSVDNRAICITSRESIALPALISSYFSRPYEYFSVFLFPDIDASYEEDPKAEEDKFIAKIIGREAKVLINNSIFRLKPKYYILAGLNEHEKTYFNFLPEKRKIIIDSEAEIPQKLRRFKRLFKSELRCRREEILQGLFLAQRKRCPLVIDEEAPSITPRNEQSAGIIILEKMGRASDVIGINLASSLRANLEIVAPFNEEKRDEIISLENHIYKWKKEGSTNSFEKIKRKINQRVGHLDFSKYDYASFITGGLPYSLVVSSIPTSYINPNLRCDMFIFNGIISEYEFITESAVVFSPEEFNDEETPYVIGKLQAADFCVKEIIGRNATVRNLENYVQHYPYDLLHICSHGGETDGYFAVEKYTDRDGREHSVEFEEIVGFSPVPGKDLIGVTRKVFFKRFDGFQWMSQEMKAQNIPNYVFEDMRKSMFAGDGGIKAKRIPANYPITSSCHIKCYDSIHQGNFQSIALYNNPIIFNNTCGSWNEISHFFLNCGAKGYIGTLWSIKNKNAKKAAELFYMNTIGRMIPTSCFLMNKFLRETSDENIYVYWGLPFANLRKPSSGRSKLTVLGELLFGLDRWATHLRGLSGSVAEVKRNTEEVVAFIRAEIMGNFKPADLKALLGQEAVEQMREAVAKAAQRRQTTTQVDYMERGVIDLGTEIRKKVH